MKICEIFRSIQGESTYAGLPCTFVRLSGCNLRCSYCDTQYSYDEGDEISVPEIIKKVVTFGTGLVEITGGEPLLQKIEVIELAEGLVDRGYKVLIETNGSLGISVIDKRAVIILDIKTPASGMNGMNDFSNFDYLKPEDEIKFVICNRNDYDWSKKIMAEHSLDEKCSVLFSPAYGMLSPRELAGWIINDRLNVRLNLQLHKYIFSPYERGV